MSKAEVMAEKVSKEISDHLNQLNKELAKVGDIKLFVAGSEPESGERIPSGSYFLDYVLGGGYMKGRIHEIFGWESSGKTSLMLHAIAEAQKMGEKCAFLDVEHALDPVYASALGVDMGKLYVAQPDTAEDTLKAVNVCINNGVTFVVVDSVAAMVPQAERDGEVGDSHVGLVARLMGQALRKLKGTIGQKGATVVFINQLRHKIGVMFGSPETTTGGKSLQFYASTRIRCAASTKEGGAADEQGEKEYEGNQIIVRAEKNKTAPPFRTRRLVIRYGKGIDRYHELAKLAEEYGLVNRKGSWYSKGGTNICQGLAALKAVLETDEDLRTMIEDELYHLMIKRGEIAPRKEA